MHFHEMIEVDEKTFYGKFAERRHRINGFVTNCVGVAFAIVVWALIYCLVSPDNPTQASVLFWGPLLAIATVFTVISGFIYWCDPPGTYDAKTWACTGCDRVIDNIAMHDKWEKAIGDAQEAKKIRIQTTMQRYAAKKQKPVSNTKKA